MSAIQLVDPNPDIQYFAGYCLRFTQMVYSAPVKHRSAWESWNATEHKHGTEENIPYVSVPVWFSHYGTYGQPPTYENWGHVVTYLPGVGYLSSPGNGYGQIILGSIEEVETYFNAKYVGWSEDINGLRVAQTTSPTPTPIPENLKDVSNMMLAHKPQPDGSLMFLLFGDNFYLEFTGQDAANAFAGQIGSASAPVSQSFFDKVKAEVDAGRC